MTWWKGAVVYQVYPRSFQDSDGDGVGDLAGVRRRLDHIAGLGVDAVWLSPVFRSPMKDFGYDVSDYRDVDPVFGRLTDLDGLIADCHARGLKVILDQVWSHTSDLHPWFLDSEAGGDRRDWYVWAKGRDGGPPNNWLSVFGGPAWTWSEPRRAWYLHNFLSAQPDLNFHEPAVQDAILDVARFWLDRGVDGFRLDVVNYYAHDPSLADNPASGREDANPYRRQRHLHDCSQPATLDFLGRLRDLLDSYEAMAVGEIFDDAPLERQRQYTDGPSRLHTAYSFFLLEARSATPALFEAAMQSWRDAQGWPSWSLGNHDVVRFPTRFDATEPACIKTLLALLFCLRGTAFLYQGDELGLPQGRVAPERRQDPFAGFSRDGARTPMPWTRDGINAGFSTAARTWLPLDEAHRTLAADVQDEDPKSVLNFVRSFLRGRAAVPALRTGQDADWPAPQGVLGFERTGEGERVLCLFELAGRSARIPVPACGRLIDLGLAGAIDAGSVMLPPWGAAIVRLA
jgi:alpha-glucosidase